MAWSPSRASSRRRTGPGRRARATQPSAASRRCKWSTVRYLLSTYILPADLPAQAPSQNRPTCSRGAADLCLQPRRARPSKHISTRQRNDRSRTAHLQRMRRRRARRVVSAVSMARRLLLRCHPTRRPASRARRIKRVGGRGPEASRHLPSRSATRRTTRRRTKTGPKSTSCWMPKSILRTMCLAKIWTNQYCLLMRVMRWFRRLPKQWRR